MFTLIFLTVSPSEMLGERIHMEIQKGRLFHLLRGKLAPVQVCGGHTSMAPCTNDVASPSEYPGDPPTGDAPSRTLMKQGAVLIMRLWVVFKSKFQYF